MKNYTFSVLFLCLFIVYPLFSQNRRHTIIPRPVQVSHGEGFFMFTADVQLYCSNNDLFEEAGVFNDYLNTFFPGFSLQPSIFRLDRNFIALSLDSALAKEEYYLEISPDFIEIRGGGKAGVFYGIQTLLQMLPADMFPPFKIQCIQIHDYPRFQWRGMHLDVSRHFFQKEFIFRYIDYLAMYKMNTFHWHLTDDQGWRIEITKYPLLTEAGGWRKGTHQGHSSEDIFIADTELYGGFYTQEDVREIVAYAQARHVTIVPEIEMPGHSMAALHAYPYLSCSGVKEPVATSWGVFEHVFCTKDEVFEFLENVLTEVMELFPGEYIHIGGDECPKTNWKKCSICQARIQSEGLKDEYELQSYFIRRIEKFVNSKGRKIIGWDEILEGGLAPNAAVMSWRGIEGGVEAAKAGHYAVMTPGSHCYFDHYQGDPANEPLAIGGYTTVEKVYSYEPVPAELNEQEATFILGAQGNVWTEYMNNEQHVEYMIFPRLCALSEVVWVPAGNKDWTDFRRRLIRHFDYFEHRGINYSKALFEIRKRVICDTIQRKIFLELSQEVSVGEIYYLMEGQDGSLHLPLIAYSVPVEITDSYTLIASAYDSEGKRRGYTKQEFVKSLSSGAKIRLAYPPSSNYNHGSPYTLVDGVSGRVPWNGKEWLGFSNTDMEAVIDLGRNEKVSRIIVHALRAEASWIYLPVGMTVWVSRDGVKYEKLGQLSAEDIEAQGRFLTLGVKKPVKARYLKVHVERAGVIGPGKPGEGHNAWLFVSEIEIR